MKKKNYNIIDTILVILAVLVLLLNLTVSMTVQIRRTVQQKQEELYKEAYHQGFEDAVESAILTLVEGREYYIEYNGDDIFTSHKYVGYPAVHAIPELIKEEEIVEEAEKISESVVPTMVTEEDIIAAEEFRTKTETSEVENPVLSNPRTEFKSYMPYTAITSKSSTQYKLQQYAYTDENGLRKIDNAYMIAVGSYYGKVGDLVEVELSTGNTFLAYIGDQKATKDTINNQYQKHDGSVIEFIVDGSSLNKTAKKLGSVSCLGFEGEVVNITVIGSFAF